MQMHSSYCVTDPKGTIVLECGKMLEDNGYEIKILNTINFKKSMKYNPFAYLRSEKDIEPYMDEKFQNNILLTQTERLTMNGRPSNPKYARNKNVLVIGGSGSGKTRFYVKPNLMQMHSSYCVTDPKGLTF